MPGLFGFYGIDNETNLSQKMLLSLKHDKDWFDGKILNHKFGFHGITDFRQNLDFKYYSLDDRSIILNGDVYSYKNNILNEKKIVNLLNLYVKDGLEFAKYLNGTFVLSIFDKDKLILINDRLGSKHLFYNINKNNIIYASEIKSILKKESLKVEFNKEAIVEFFTFSHLLGNKTFFKNIEVIPPATCFIYNQGNLVINKYYKLTSEKKKIKNFDLYPLLKEFSLLMEKSIRERIKNKNKIGVFLSGGLDSRLLAGFTKRIADKLDKEIISFTFGTKGGIQEKIANQIAKKLKIKNIFYEIPTTLISNYAEEIVYKGDGHIRIRDSHFIAHLEDIRKQVDIVISGLFCSELFGDFLYKFFQNFSDKKSFMNFLFNFKKIKILSTHIDRMFSKSFELPSMEILQKNFFASVEENYTNSFIDTAHFWDISQLCRRYIFPVSNFISWYIEPILPFLDNEIINFAIQLPLELRYNKKFIHKANRYLFPNLANVPWERTHLPPDTHGLLFYLSIKVMEYIERIKQKIERMSNHHIIFRSSNYTAYDYFIRTGSREYITDSLLKNQDKTIWNQKYLHYLIREHLLFRNNYDQIICDILQIDLVKKLFFL